MGLPMEVGSAFQWKFLVSVLARRLVSGGSAPDVPPEVFDQRAPNALRSTGGCLPVRRKKDEDELPGPAVWALRPSSRSREYTSMMHDTSQRTTNNDWFVSGFRACARCFLGACLFALRGGQHGVWVSPAPEPEAAAPTRHRAHFRPPGLSLFAGSGRGGGRTVNRCQSQPSDRS